MRSYRKSTGNRRTWRMAALGGALALAAGGLAACGGSSATTGGGNATAGAGNATVTVAPVGNIGQALVDPNGKTLYFADQESAGQIKCTDSCVQFWVPLTVPAGSQPVAGSGVGTLGTLTRPDGSVQVTEDGHPLYTFVQDHGAGQASGDGFTDSFNGTEFHWHAATPGGGMPAPSQAPSQAPSPAASQPGGGYGY